MLIHFEDADYEFDLDNISLTDARYLKRQLGGLSLLKIQEGIFESDPDCLAAAYWLMQKSAGKVVDIHKVNFNAGALSMALGEAYLEEAKRRAEEEAEENPTKAVKAEAPAKK